MNKLKTVSKINHMGAWKEKTTEIKYQAKLKKSLKKALSDKTTSTPTIIKEKIQ